ncbi:MAG: hypothetical protein K2F87_01370 [Muribaculaceae bacterium]|nr:hypothetical protein [Muribaculaceae bacterium]
MAEIKSSPDNIELRSDPPRRSIGEIPRSLVCWGIVSTIVIFLTLLLATILIPYPYSHGESILEHLLTGISRANG